MGRRVTRQSFIEKYEARHGTEQWDFTKFEYAGSDDKAIVTCNRCGNDQKMITYNILSGKGCKSCSLSAQAKRQAGDPESFRNRMGEISPHINLEKFVYTTQQVKSTALCTKHDIEWSVTPSNLLQGRGCWECGLDARSDAQRMDDEKYKMTILDIEARGYTLDQSRTYRANEKIPTSCNTCGHSWEPFFSNLIHKQTGCHHCGNLNRGNHNSVSQEQFRDHLALHPLKIWHLQSVQYVDYSTPVKLTCIRQDHHVELHPRDLHSGATCPQCDSIDTLPFLVYLMELAPGTYKIGLSRHLNRRWYTFRTGHPEVKLLRFWEMPNEAIARACELKALSAVPGSTLTEQEFGDGYTETRVTNLTAPEVIWRLNSLLENKQ